MKIVEMGTVRKDVPPSTGEEIAKRKQGAPPWVGKTIRCTRCSCLFLLESSDEYEKVKCHRDDLGHAEAYSLSCPGCGHHIQLELDELRKESNLIKQ